MGHVLGEAHEALGRELGRRLEHLGREHIRGDLNHHVAQQPRLAAVVHAPEGGPGRGDEAPALGEQRGAEHDPRVHLGDELLGHGLLVGGAVGGVLGLAHLSEGREARRTLTPLPEQLEYFFFEFGRPQGVDESLESLLECVGRNVLEEFGHHPTQRLLAAVNRNLPGEVGCVGGDGGCPWRAGGCLGGFGAVRPHDLLDEASQGGGRERVCHPLRELR
mmetsp:Transcript_67719/g.153239  ORF Transcript_67719/g.153239 Transcript_67719/m.153239 type:complete len:219 (-) Transcript_67719:1289-1945(-)